MSVTIRLSKTGKRNAPSYKVVVSNTRDKRDGRFLDILGYFNPSANPQELKIDQEKFTAWKDKGALVTDAVEKLVAGDYQYAKYNPKKQQEKAVSEEKPSQEKESVEEEKVEEKPSETKEEADSEKSAE
jgi:small subunit ribosomal protein S16